jgi:parallel beta-helix repeat protein
MSAFTFLRFCLYTQRRRRALNPRLGLELLEDRLTPSPTSAHFDFGTDSSPVAPGYTGVPLVAYTPSQGYGWQSLTGLGALDRGTANPLTRDFHYGPSGTFLVDLANGYYAVRPTLGDALALHDDEALWANGIRLASSLTTRAGQFIRPTFGVSITNGQLALQIVDQGGSDPNFAIDGLDINADVPLTANAGPSQTTNAGTPLTFAGSESGGTGPFSYAWNFGDGSKSAGSLTPTHTYTAAGTYLATLMVTDGYGLKSRATTVITVTPANPVTSFQVTGFPSPATAGVAGSFTVTAKDAYGNTVTSYTGTVDFASSSQSATLPSAYTFTATDQGVHTFSATLNMIGTQSLTVVDSSSGIEGTQSGINVTQTQGNIYYVSTTGSDSNPGTIGQPFLTINHGVSVLNPGDTLYIRGGTYAESLINDVQSGTSWNAPVTVAAYAGETVTLQPGSGQFVIELYGNYQYIIFNNLTLDATNVSDSGFYLDNAGSGATANHIRLENSEVKNAPNQGVIVGCENNIASNYNEFIHVVSHDNGPGGSLHHGFYISGSYALLDGCEAYGNGGFGIQIYRGGGINGIDASYNTVRNCKLHDNGAAGLEIAVGDGNVAYNNLIWNNPSGIFVEYGASNTGLYNNTIYNSTNANDFAIRIGYSGGASNTTVENNLIWQTAGSDAIANYGTGTVCSYNLGDKVMQNEGTGSGTFSHNLVGSSYNPLFVNAAAADFHLQSSSPAINAGTLLALVATDFDGVSRPQGGAYDIGAYEYH